MIKLLKSIIKLVVFVVVMIVFISCNKATSANATLETTNVNVDKENNSSNKTIYFAGPLFSDAEIEFNLKLTKVLEDCGYKVYLPQRDTGLVADLDINPMLSECFIKIFKDSDGDSLIKTLKEYLSNNDL